MAKSKEIHFEDEVFDVLTTDSGWTAGVSNELDLATGLRLEDVFAFIADTQPDEWSKFAVTQASEAAARTEFTKRLVSEINQRGTVDVLRHGIKGWGRRFKLCSFRPAHGLTPELSAAYAANRAVVTRQQRYTSANTNTLDLCLFLNGLPVATLELKNPLTGQTVENAKAQYRTDRDPKDVFLSKRAVVHFAVDPHLVFMTTRLAGAKTRFLPFNRGHDHHAGNPPAADGRHATAYLWEDVLTRDRFIDLVGRFIHTEIDETGSATGTVIFPRYHQWDCVLRLAADAKANGAGRRYLIQHSAGSGKSNSISWLAHRLSSLHDDSDQQVFDKVIVITDRVVLDAQLAATIEQFDHVTGVVKRVEAKAGSKSSNLAEALASSTARIIICTLQTFSFVDDIPAVDRKRFAVIVDEAHSSQTGEAAKDLKGVLGAEAEEERLKISEKEEAGDLVTDEDRLNEAVAARAAQSNLSFFAFTATPKQRTGELFGTLDPVTGVKGPFHTYSMRQAIEEGFILDVLRFYTPFDVFWKVAKANGDDPEVDKTKAAAQIAKAISLHPHNLARKAQVIIDHFREHVAPQIDSQAKAMVVTASRLHAVRYKQAIDAYIADHHITGVAAVVAFSGKVIDPADPTADPYTEANKNGFPESETAARFKGEPSPPFDPDDYQVLIVAEKFQTGFDAPLLHTMYVDKKLEGVNAVQTLARLNRTHPGKDTTFVLDFRNDPDDIANGFRPFYDTTLVEPVDANTLYSYQGVLTTSGVFTTADVDRYWTVFSTVAPNDRKGNGALYAALAGGLGAFNDLDDEAQDQFRSDLDSYTRAYSFLSQIVTWTDGELEKTYVYAKSLAANLPRREGDGGLDLGSEVELTHLRIEEKGRIDASLAGSEPDTEPLPPFGPGGGTGAGDPQHERLSKVVERLNERHALNLTITDALLFEQFKGDWLADEDLAAKAKVNDYEHFLIAFGKKFLLTVLTRMDKNADIFKAINDDDGFADDLKALYGRDVYEALRGPG